MEGSAGVLYLWFRGPRPLGDFLVELERLRFAKPAQLLLSPPAYVATMPDDMLAMEELYLARQGMADSARCLRCQSGAVQPIVTSAQQQTRGCAWRAVRFFCTGCGSVHDGVERGPEPPCPVPQEVWATMRKFPPDMPAFLSRPMDMDSLRYRLRKLPKDKAPGRDGVPYEYFRYGPRELYDYLLAAVNALMSGSHALPADWLGVLVTLLPKSANATTMKQFRPITNLSSGYKLCAAEVADRMMRIF